MPQLEPELACALNGCVCVCMCVYLEKCIKHILMVANGWLFLLIYWKQSEVLMERSGIRETRTCWSQPPQPQKQVPETDWPTKKISLAFVPPEARVEQEGSYYSGLSFWIVSLLLCLVKN